MQGIIIDSKLTFADHVVNVATKATTKLYRIRRFVHLVICKGLQHIIQVSSATALSRGNPVQ